MEGYCTECKKMRRIENPSTTVSRNQKFVVEGDCRNCGSPITKFYKPHEIADFDIGEKRKNRMPIDVRVGKKTSKILKKRLNKRLNIEAIKRELRDGKTSI